jgi:hypothetical protein
LGRLKTLLLQETIDTRHESLGPFKEMFHAACLGAEEDDVLYAIAGMRLEAIQEASQSLSFSVAEVRQAGF